MNPEPLLPFPPDKLPQILRLPRVMEATGLSRSSIYAFAAKGTFPQPVRLGERAIGWKEADVRAWLDARRAAA